MFYDIIQQTYFHNRLLDYLFSLSILIIGLLVVRILKGVILKRFKIWAARTDTKIDDFIIHTFEKALLPVFYFGAFYLAMGILVLPSALEKSIDVIGIVVLTFFSVRFLIALISHVLEVYWVTKGDEISKTHGIKGIKGVLPVIKVVVWGVGIAFLLDNLGFKISTVVAGLGIGGVAVALAAQAVLGDLFSYIAIQFDRPFEIGDFIIVGDKLGTIEHVGIKTTRIRSLGGEQLIFSNTDLTNSRVRNYKRMDKRRVVFKFGVIYQTSLEHMKEIPAIITDIVKKVEDATFDRAHFCSYGDFSLDFEVVYYVIGSDYNKYMDIQQEINLAIMEEFKKRGIEFAYPTQTLFLNKT
jgi:small-conductance mechanosensitive channel